LHCHLQGYCNAKVLNLAAYALAVRRTAASGLEAKPKKQWQATAIHSHKICEKGAFLCRKVKLPRQVLPKCETNENTSKFHSG
jgi:hypothetical protein